MKRFLKATTLAMTVALAMACLLAIPASAAITGSSGASQTPASNGHTDNRNRLHLPDGTHLSKATVTKKEHAFLQDWERLIYNNDLLTLPKDMEVGVLNIKVGEKVVLHARQENITMGPPYKGARGMAQNRPGDTVHADTYTVKRLALADFGLDDLAQSTASGGTGGAGDYTVYCLEWQVVGQYEGVDYLWYQDGITDGEYVKIVVSAD